VNDPRAEMAISETELRSMTRDLDDMHEDSFGSVRESMTDLGERLASITRINANRRVFLLGSAAAVGAVTLAACGSSGGSSPAVTSSTSGSAYTGDLKVVALAAALENLAVAAYGMALTAAGKGTYGAVPPAVAEFVTTARKQHSDHAAAWNGVLAQAGKPRVTGTPLTITQGAVDALGKAKSVPEVATIALNLENVAAQTYVFATANVQDSGGIATAATIAPVEAMHAAILSFILGKYPVPDNDIGTSKALQPSALTA
jgi:hypothetical protein